jgi:predicted dehydrogenase
MKAIIGTRGIGKSARLLEFASRNDYIFITGSPSAAKDLAKTMGILEKVDIVPYSFKRIKELEESGTPYVVDGLELFMNRTFPNLQGYTLDLDLRGNT